MANFVNAILCRMMVEWNAFKKQERGAVDLVVVVVLIGLALALAVLFRNQIIKVLNKLFSSIRQNASQVTQPIQGE